MFATSNFNWILKELLIFFLNVHRNGVEMMKFEALMRSCVLVFDMRVMLSLCWLHILVFVNHARQSGYHQRCEDL